MFRPLWYIGLLAMLSCNFVARRRPVVSRLGGNWLIVYPDHGSLKNEVQRKLYAGMQDSIVGLTGLKLISFELGGNFMQVDSFFAERGYWRTVGDSLLVVGRGGKGFQPFRARPALSSDDDLLLTQYIPVPGDSLKLVWHLKRIDRDDSAASLFAPASNAWRRHPRRPESPAAVRKRLKAMLSWYADYYALVSREANYFCRSRVFLPLTYYQHGIGLNDFKVHSPFAGCFYDSTQAAEAYHLLGEAIEQDRDYPSGKDFVIEYARCFRQLAHWLGE